MKGTNILETNALHASDILYWLDGSSAESITEMQRIPHRLHLQLSTKPLDLQLQHSPGKTAIWRRPTTEIVEGIASEADKAFTPSAPFSLAGTVFDLKGYFNPRTFSITAGNANGHSLVLYPTPLGTHFKKGGGLIGMLRFTTNNAIVPWALLTLIVALPGGGSQTYRAQSNDRGDFIISMNRLPPLPEGVNEYAAQLSVAALASATPQTPLATTDLVAMGLEDLNTSATFSNPIGFNVVPGDIQLIRSADKDHLAVQPC